VPQEKPKDGKAAMAWWSFGGTKSANLSFTIHHIN
jgi:hypothetical protein